MIAFISGLAAVQAAEVVVVDSDTMIINLDAKKYTVLGQTVKVPLEAGDYEVRLVRNDQGGTYVSFHAWNGFTTCENPAGCPADGGTYGWLIPYGVTSPHIDKVNGRFLEEGKARKIGFCYFDRTSPDHQNYLCSKEMVYPTMETAFTKGRVNSSFHLNAADEVGFGVGDCVACTTDNLEGISLWVHKVSDDGQITAQTTGLKGLTAICKNLTTRQTISFPLYDTNSLNCDAAGLEHKAGDRVDVLIKGNARK